MWFEPSVNQLNDATAGELLAERKLYERAKGLLSREPVTRIRLISLKSSDDATSRSGRAGLQAAATLTQPRRRPFTIPVRGSVHPRLGSLRPAQMHFDRIVMRRQATDFAGEERPRCRRPPGIEGRVHGRGGGVR